MALLMVKSFSHESIFKLGHFSIGCCLIATSFYVGQGEQMLVLNGLAFSLFIQQLLNAAVIAYQAEKVMDSAFGACTALRLFVY